MPKNELSEQAAKAALKLNLNWVSAWAQCWTCWKTWKTVFPNNVWMIECPYCGAKNPRKCAGG